MQRLLLWGLRRYIGGPARSWVFTSLAVLGMRAAKSVVGRRELIDVGDVKPGQKIVIESLPISHKKQIKTFKADGKAAKKAAKATKKDAKATKAGERRAAKEAKAAKKSAKAETKRAKAEAREVKSAARAQRRSARRTSGTLVD